MKRYLDAFAGVPSTLGYGLKQKLKEGYTGGDFRADLMAGLVVGVVALPLSMALAIASGVPPQHGLYTAIIAGVVCALLGGTRYSPLDPASASTTKSEPPGSNASPCGRPKLAPVVVTTPPGSMRYSGS